MESASAVKYQPGFVNKVRSFAHIIPEENSVRFVVKDHHNDASVGSRMSKVMQTLTKNLD